MLETAIQLLLTYKYIVLFPIALIEGPIITIIAGFFAQLGYLNIWIAIAVVSVADLVGDVIWYYVGYHRGHAFTLRAGKYFGVTEESIAKAKLFFHKYHDWILFLSKITGAFGFIIPILFTAGMSRVPFRRYMAINALGEVVWTTALSVVGYFFGSLYTVIDGVLSRVMLGVAILVVIILIIRLRTYLKNKFIQTP